MARARAVHSAWPLTRFEHGYDQPREDREAAALGLVRLALHDPPAWAAWKARYAPGTPGSEDALDFAYFVDGLEAEVERSRPAFSSILRT